MIEANVKSILAKTPPDLLDSIIVVDDCSEFLPISSSILELSPKVQLIRTDSPKGVAGGTTSSPLLILQKQLISVSQRE